MPHLTTPSPDIIGLIRASDLAESTKTKYCRAVEGYLAGGGRLTDAAALRAYAAGCSASRRGHLKSALKLWLQALEQGLKGQARPELVAEIQATLWRLEAMAGAISAPQPKRKKLHLWLSQRQVKRLIASCPADTLRGQRDRIVLGLLTGAGLRREELVHLTLADIGLRPVGGQFRTVLHIKGKGAKQRTVPVSDRLAAALEAWGGRLGGRGPVARAISPGGALGERLSAVAVFNLVAKAGAAINQPNLAPHDLRRTYAQLGYEAGVPITQISQLLGHASVATTQRYLNLELDLATTVGDFIPFE